MSPTLSLPNRQKLRNPKSTQLRDRGLVHYQLRNYQQALDDLQDYLETTETIRDIPSVQRFMAQIRRDMGR